MGMHKTQTISRHCGVVFSGSESPWTPWNKSVFQRIKEKCTIISKVGEMHLSFSKLSSCFFKEGLTGEEGIWREGKGKA